MVTEVEGKQHATSLATQPTSMWDHAFPKIDGNFINDFDDDNYIDYGDDDAHYLSGNSIHFNVKPRLSWIDDDFINEFDKYVMYFEIYVQYCAVVLVC